MTTLKIHFAKIKVVIVLGLFLLFTWTDFKVVIVFLASQNT